MTRRSIYPDLEFNPADPAVTGTLSIGIVDDADRTFYAINNAADLTAVGRNPWLVDNVVPHLPITVHARYTDGAVLTWDTAHPAYTTYAFTPAQIALALADWLGAAHETPRPVRMYGYYGAQDITRLHGLWDNDWNAMPDVVPRYFTELQSIIDALGITKADLPEELTGELSHDALDDARWHRSLHRHLRMRINGSVNFGALGAL